VTVDLAEVNAAARAAHFGRAALTGIAAVLWAVGWLVGKLVAGVWFVVAWVFAAVRLGWRDARPKPVEQAESGWVEVE
jgi:hypothetical protein